MSCEAELRWVIWAVVRCALRGAFRFGACGSIWIGIYFEELPRSRGIQCFHCTVMYTKRVVDRMLIEVDIRKMDKESGSCFEPKRRVLFASLC